MLFILSRICISIFHYHYYCLGTGEMFAKISSPFRSYSPPMSLRDNGGGLALKKVRHSKHIDRNGIRFYIEKWNLGCKFDYN